MSPSQQQLVADSIARAWEAHRTAQHDLAGGFTRGAGNRLYYAVFYAVTALVKARGETLSKHAGVRGFLNREFVKSGKLSTELGDLYSDLFDQRTKGDYDFLTFLDPKVVEPQVPQVASFIRRVEEILTELGWQLGAEP